MTSIPITITKQHYDGRSDVNSDELFQVWMPGNTRRKTIELAIKAVSLAWAELSHDDLSGLDLSGLDLSYANLKFTNLSNANLTNTNLSNACLIGADLTGAILDNTNFQYADLSYTTLDEIHPRLRIIVKPLDILN